MTLDRIFSTLLISMVLWVIVYNNVAAYPVAVTVFGFTTTCLLIFLFTREQETLRKGLELVDQQVMQEEIRRRAAEAHSAVNFASEAERKHLLGIGDKKSLKAAIARRDTALKNFTNLRDAALKTGNSIIGSSIKDYVE